MKFLTPFMRHLYPAGPAQVAAPSASAPGLAGVPGFDRLEVQAAIIQHLEWCVAFNEHLRADPGDAATRQALAGPQDSGLGRWLADALARTDGPQPFLDELMAEYQGFHQLAQQALTLAQADQMHQASTLLNTDFERSRARVLKMLRALQRS